MESTNSFSRPTVLFAESHWRSGDGARQWSRVFLGARCPLEILDASFKVARASYFGLHGSHGQPCAWNREHSGNFCVSSAVIGVCAGLMSATVRMRQKKGSRSRFVKVDAVSWLRRWVVSWSGQGSREASGPSVPGRVRFAPSRQMSIWNVRVRTRIRCLLPEGRVARTSVRFRDNFWIPRNRKWEACGGFCREENIIVLEARFILFAVRHAEGSHPPGRLLILSDNLALVAGTQQWTFTHFFIASSHASYLCVWSQVRLCLIVQVDIVRIELCRQRKSFL